MTPEDEKALLRAENAALREQFAAIADDLGTGSDEVPALAEVGNEGC
jgi:hypothetical protein